MADVHLYSTGAVHFSYPLLKQRRSVNLRRVTRRVKFEWCPLFVEYIEKSRSALNQGSNFSPTDSFFGLAPNVISDMIPYLTKRITGEPITAMDLRHSAAQRLADSGSSHIGLSEFMGHASLNTAQVYFDTSPTQAQRVNQALAISPIYSVVAEVARTKTIDKSILLKLPPEKQIGGAPHGIPIAGIGGCRIGQSLCSKNPILSCYTCRKFMPLHESTIHEQVVESLRSVVNEFVSAAKGNEESPAYTQLRGMLSSALRIAEEIKTGQTEKVNLRAALSDE